MRYTTSTVVGTVLGTTFSSSTDPTETEVATIASFVSETINQTTGRIWTTATASEYLDVWDADRESLYGGRSNADVQDAFFLSKTPVTDIAFLRENMSSLGSAPSWVSRATGLGGDFTLYGKEGMVKFHKSFPNAGRRRLLVSYTHGVETTPDDIKYAAALLTAVEVLTMIKRASDQEGLKSVSIGDASYEFGDLDSQREKIQKRADNILSARGRTLHMEAL